MVSGLRKIKRKTASFVAAESGMASTEEMNATWKETRIWLAMTQPSCRKDPLVKLPKKIRPGAEPGEENFADLSRDAANFMAPVLFGIAKLYPCDRDATMICVNRRFVISKWMKLDAFPILL